MPIRELFSLRGRASRLGFWRFYLGITAASAVVWCGGLFAIIGLGPWAGFLLLALFPLWAMSAALVVRRVHDRGRGTPWAVIFVFGPLALIEPAQTLLRGPNPDLTPMATILAWAGLALGAWGFVEIGFRRGTAGPNPYGPDPLGKSDRRGRGGDRLG
jgi:uncharacterized membrane protein YhaH (DUF805 family)